MHIEILQIVLLLMEKSTSATWNQELEKLLETVENTPPLLEGLSPNPATAWLQASEEYLIKPVLQNRSDTDLGRQTCRKTDKAATLFNPDIDSRGIELIKDSITIASSKFQVDKKFLIERSLGLQGQCTYVSLNSQELSTSSEACSRRPTETIVICIRKSQPTPRLAGILRQHLSHTTIKTETITTNGLKFNNNTPSYITDMTTTLGSETNKLRVIWAIETMAVIQGGISSTTFEMIQSLTTEMSKTNAKITELEDRDKLPTPAQLNLLERISNMNTSLEHLTNQVTNSETLINITKRVRDIEEDQTKLFEKLESLEVTLKEPTTNGELGSGLEGEDTHLTTNNGLETTSKVLSRQVRSPIQQTQSGQGTPEPTISSMGNTSRILGGLHKYLISRNLNDCLSCKSVYLALAIYICLTVIQCFFFLVLCCRSTGSRQLEKRLKIESAETKQRVGMLESNLLQVNQTARDRAVTAAAGIRSNSRTTPRFLPSAPALHRM